MLLRVLASPGARANEIEWTVGGGLRVRLAAPPADGKANRELVGFLAQVLDVSSGSVRLLKGASSRHKVVEIDGLEDAEVWRRLGRPDPS